MTKETPGDEWMTPEWVWKPWHDRLFFKLDAAANENNKIVDNYISKNTDALVVDWSTCGVRRGDAVWCNPPYSQLAGPLDKWVAKFFQEARLNGLTIVSLLLADISTRWFDRVYDRGQNAWRVGCQGTFLGQRVKHQDPITRKSMGSPKFGSMIVIFSPLFEQVYAKGE
jgi:phage N-6-adenine-methyltransferase